MTNSFWRERGEATIDGEVFRFYRENLASGKFIIDTGGRPIAKAVKQSALKRAFEVETNEKRFILKPKSALSRTFVLQHGDRTVGTIAPLRALSRKITANLPDDLSMPVQIFILWLVILMWKRAVAAASG